MENFAKLSVGYEIPREMNTVENLTRHLPFSSFWIFFFSQVSHLKDCIQKNSYQKFDKIILN